MSGEDTALVECSSEESLNSRLGSSPVKNKDAGHYEFRVGMMINQYKVLRHLGDGTFGRVLEVLSLENYNTYAMKVIRAVERYVRAAKSEAKTILDIEKRAKKGESGIVNLYESFEFGDNYCMVFEKLGPSLYDFLKANHYKGYPVKYVQEFFKQILQVVGFMHESGITHTDLKPENVLLATDKKKTCSRTKIPYELDRSTNYRYYVPQASKIKLIDFGGAVYDHEYHGKVINTRQYRAPEVILDCITWDHSNDIWSIGCIIVEIYSGELFFETHESYEHMAMIQKVSGAIPQWMGKNSENEFKDFFSESKNGRVSFDWPRNASSNESIKRVEKMRTLDDLINPKHTLLKDLLKKCFEIDPKKRISAKDALEHPFFAFKL